MSAKKKQPESTKGLYKSINTTHKHKQPERLYKRLYKTHIVLFYPVLEVCQFARDASVAEAWLVAQEPYVTSRDLGHTVDEVEKLLKRHEAFEKSTATWEERFSALERLTTVLGDMH